MDININTAEKIHFIGIGGISMSALALIMKKHGHIVTGSDTGENDVLNTLRENGITVYKNHLAENVGDSTLVVYTAAIKDDNPELVYARKMGIKTMERCVLLGILMKKYRHAINVSGTHGKTTTTSMLAVIMQEAGLDPTVTVGGELSNIGGNLRLGSSPYFLTEACEYVDSFLKFFPTIAIITNIDLDHLDYFKNIEQIIASFNAFAKKLPKDGLLVINADDENSKKALDGVVCPIKTCSTKNKDADYYAGDIEFKNGCASFDLFINGERKTRICLGVAGLHNVYNALAVIAVCVFLGLSSGDVAEYIGEFSGTHRRFEEKGSVSGAVIYDDYAHHPTEIKTTLKSAREICRGDLYCVFQPHTYTRTKALLSEFATSFSDCTRVIITDIYAAREKDTGLVSSKDLADKIENAVYIKDFADIAEKLRGSLKEGDICITMGAGDVFKIGDMLLAGQTAEIV